MNEEYIDNVKQLIEQKDANKVKEFLINLHPADIAELCNDLNPEEARFVYRLLDNETAADVLVERTFVKNSLKFCLPRQSPNASSITWIRMMP